MDFVVNADLYMECKTCTLTYQPGYFDWGIRYPSCSLPGLLCGGDQLTSNLTSEISLDRGLMRLGWAHLLWEPCDCVVVFGVGVA